MKIANARSLKTIIARKPPDFPAPLRAIRCLITPPPRSASIKPRFASWIVEQRSASVTSFFRAKRANFLFLNTRIRALSSWLTNMTTTLSTTLLRQLTARPDTAHSGSAVPHLHRSLTIFILVKVIRARPQEGTTPHRLRALPRRFRRLEDCDAERYAAPNAGTSRIIIA